MQGGGGGGGGTSDGKRGVLINTCIVEEKVMVRVGR